MARAETVLAVLIRQRHLAREEVVQEFARIADELGCSATLSVTQLDRLRFGDLLSLPRPATVRVLERQFGRTIRELLAPAGPTAPPAAAGHDPRSTITGTLVHELPPSSAVSLITPGSVAPSPMSGMLGGPPPENDGLLRALDHVRLLVDETLCTATVSSVRLDLVEERVADHIVAYTQQAPVTALGALTPDVVEVRALAARRQPAVTQARLSEVMAVLALLSADALMKLGQIGRARHWYGTARLAADDTPNRELRARVRAQEAMLPYYYGRPERTVRLARVAQHLCGPLRCDAGALAAAAEARALARLGDRDGAEQAMARAERAVDELDHPRPDVAFQFTEKRLLLYRSGTLTYLGETARARRAQEQALALYRSQPKIVIDPALIQLDQAVCDARDGDVDSASQRAITTLHGLPAEHRTYILTTRAREVVDAIPVSHRGRPVVGELRELIAVDSGDA